MCHLATSNTLLKFKSIAKTRRSIITRLRKHKFFFFRIFLYINERNTDRPKQQLFQTNNKMPQNLSHFVKLLKKTYHFYFISLNITYHFFCNQCNSHFIVNHKLLSWTTLFLWFILQFIPIKSLIILLRLVEVTQTEVYYIDRCIKHYNKWNLYKRATIKWIKTKACKNPQMLMVLKWLHKFPSN